MSRIHELGTKLENIPDIVDQYEQAFAEIEQNLTLKGKALDFALKEQASWPIYYDARKIELKALVKFMELQVDRVRGKLMRTMNDASSLKIGERMLGSYVEAEPEYIMMRTLLIEIEELYEKFAAAGEAFNKRGFALRDLTASRIAQIQDYLL